MNSASGYQKNLSGRAEQITTGVLRIWMSRKVKGFICSKRAGLLGDEVGLQLPHG
jgi:hypothetical protein